MLCNITGLASFNSCKAETYHISVKYIINKTLQEFLNHYKALEQFCVCIMKHEKQLTSYFQKGKSWQLILLIDLEVEKEERRCSGCKSDSFNTESENSLDSRLITRINRDKAEIHIMFLWAGTLQRRFKRCN